MQRPVVGAHNDGALRPKTLMNILLAEAQDQPGYEDEETGEYQKEKGKPPGDAANGDQAHKEEADHGHAEERAR
jgi:hypothetical protein